VALLSADAEFSRNPVLGAKANSEKQGFRIVHEATYPLTTGIAICCSSVPTGRTSRAVFSFSLRSPLTQQPSVIDVAYWPIAPFAAAHRIPTRSK
jgi:hypothetical protein